MSRPVDHARRTDLLDGAVDYVIDHGISDLSLRPLAAALQVGPTTLVHHFGSKEDLLGAILNRVREQIVAALRLPAPAEIDPEATLTEAWAWISDPRHHPLFRLFFEVYGQALTHPQRFGPFLERVVDDWLEALSRSFQRVGYDREHARRQATLGLAITRGLLLDLLTSGDTVRVNDALASYARHSSLGLPSESPGRGATMSP